MPTIDLGKIGFAWRGAFNGSSIYEPRDVVGYQNSIYMCKAPVTAGLALPTNAAYWESWVEDTTWGGAGDVFFTAAATAPPGSLKANGAAVLRSTYEALDAAIYCGDSLNATASWGYRCTNATSPTTTRSLTGSYIVVPDLRGEFLRGWDDGRGVDARRVRGSSQGFAIENIVGRLSSAGAHAFNSVSGLFTPIGSSGGIAPATGNNPGWSSVEFNVGNGGFSVSNETRPRNTALLACIRYR